MTNQDQSEDIETKEVSLRNRSKSSFQSLKYLIFTLGKERYGIPLASVKEVIGTPAIRPIPQAPNYFKGMINLRGQIISVVDLNLCLGIIESHENAKKRKSIIITEMKEYILGIIVDDVNEVASYEESQIEETDQSKQSERTRYIRGIAHSKDKSLTLLLDMEKTFTENDVSMFIAYSKSKAA